MLIKIAIVLFLLMIVYSLATSFFFLVRDKGQGTRTVQRLSWRIGLSMVLVLALAGAAKMGWIEAGGVQPVNYPQQSTEQ